MISLIVLSIAILAMPIIAIIARWRVFTKAGEAGWKSIIPIYSDYTLACIATKNDKLRIGTLVAQTMCFVATIMYSMQMQSATGSLYASEMMNSQISTMDQAIFELMTSADQAFVLLIVAAIADYVIKLIVNYKLAEAFDESRAFGILLAIQQWIGMIVLAFDDGIEYLEPAD